MDKFNRAASLLGSTDKYAYAYGWLSGAVELFLESGDKDRLRRAFEEIESALEEVKASA